jgi:hypothetical protein
MPFQKGHPGGPGRPSTKDKFVGAIAKADTRIAKNLSRYIENMEALADGVFVEEMTIVGVRMVYQRPPDRAANEYLINRIMGKPTERKELSGPDGEPLFKAYEATDAFDPDSA